MAEVADPACNGEQLLEMRKTANQIPVANEVLRYAMTLCSATHPTGDCATETAKKYIRLGASPRAGQALISAAKVRALLLVRFNVSYNDVNALAYPVLRHRMKLTFEAIAERISPDEIVTMIIKEVNGKTVKIEGAKYEGDKVTSTATVSEQMASNDKEANSAQTNTAEQSANAENKAGSATESALDEGEKKSKRGLFRKK
jgi:MoxR-like ATPase